jgi:hypothetical protein
MKPVDRYIRDEMDIIILKTYRHVKQVLDDRGVEEAKDLILMIAHDIKKQFIEGNMSDDEANKLYDLFISEINAAVFGQKH